MKRKMCPFDKEAFKISQKDGNPLGYLVGCFEEAKALAGIEVTYLGQDQTQDAEQAQGPNKNSQTKNLNEQSVSQLINKNTKRITSMTMNELLETFHAMGFYPSEYQIRVAYEYACLKARLQPLLKDIKPQSITAPEDHLKRILRVQEKNILRKKLDGTAIDDNNDDCNGQSEVSKRQSQKRSFVFNEDCFVEWLQHNVLNLSVDRIEVRKRGKSIQISMQGSHGAQQNAENNQNNGLNLSMVEVVKQRKIREIEGKIDNLAKILEEINQLRQDNGQIPCDLDKKNIDFKGKYLELPALETNITASRYTKNIQLRSIPFEPDSYQLNKRINRLREQAEQELIVLVELCQHDAGFKEKIEKSMETFKQMRIENNLKIGQIVTQNAQNRVHRAAAENILKQQKEDELLGLLDRDKIRSLRIEKLMQKTAHPKGKFQRLVQPGGSYEKRLLRLINKDSLFYA